MEWILLDVRELEHPRPLEMVLESLNALEPEKGILMVHRREPFPLYEILKERGIPFHTRRITDTHFEIRIGEAATC